MGLASRGVAWGRRVSECLCLWSVDCAVCARLRCRWPSSVVAGSGSARQAVVASGVWSGDGRARHSTERESKSFFSYANRSRTFAYRVRLVEAPMGGITFAVSSTGS